MSVFGVILVALSRIRTEYRDILRISPYSVRMRENTDQNNSEYRLFSSVLKFKGLYGHTFTEFFVYLLLNSVFFQFLAS